MLVQKEQEAVSVDAAEAKLLELLQVDDFWSCIDERLHTNTALNAVGDSRASRWGAVGGA